MSKRNILPEPLAWALGALLAPLLALPWAWGENGLTPADFLARPFSAAGGGSDFFQPRVPSSAAALDDLTLLRPESALWDELKDRPAPPPAESRYDDLIATAARRHQVSPLLVKAVILAESNFDPGAVSPNGAVGLMQVMPATARAFGVRDLRDPRQNIEAGVRYLKILLDSFGDDEALAVAAYNCGPEALRRFNNEVPPFPETRNYVERVMKYYSRHLDG